MLDTIVGVTMGLLLIGICVCILSFAVICICVAIEGIRNLL